MKTKIVFSMIAGLIPALGLADTVTINGQRQQYRSLSATGATKTDAQLLDLPQSVRVLTPTLLRDAGVENLAGALDLASGIARQSDLGGLWDSYAMRGFTGDPNFGSDYMVNGFSSSRGYNGVRDMAASHSIEVLKGPASALYGRGEPGGTVNIITKKPRFNPEYALAASVASHRHYRTALDLTGPLGATLAYRLNAACEQGDSFRDTVQRTKSFISPSLIWLPAEGTTLSYEVESSRQQAPFDRGVLAVRGQLGRIPSSRFLGEPGDGPMLIESLGHQLFAQHDLLPGWALQAGLAYRESALSGFSSEANNLLADQRTLRRQRRHRDFSATDRSARLELLGQFGALGMTHQLLLGVDAYRFDDHRVQLRRNPSAANPYEIDLYAPVYGGLADPLTLSVDTIEQQRAHGLYLQDQVTLAPRWKALAGVRYDSYRQEVRNRRTAQSNLQQLHASSPRAGLVYQPGPATSVYASAARGYRPNSGISIDNRAFPAEQSQALEAGAKFDSADGKLSGSMALYRIEKKNVLTTNPVNTDFSISAGEVASKGVELDMAGELMAQLRVSAAYALTDARVSKGDLTIVSGSRFPNVARHSANLLLVRSFRLNAREASVGAGLHHVGKRMGEVAASGSFELPAYTTARLMASYAPSQQLRLSLQVENLFDKAYYASSYSQLWVAPGTERSVALHLQYRH